MSVLRCLAALLAIAAQGFSLTSLRAQNSISNLVPVVSIRASVARSRRRVTLTRGEPATRRVDERSAVVAGLLISAHR